jgi:hypothetical protein
MSDGPQECPECGRKFAWGRDADSASVEAQGEQWLSCAENAHWKLTFHMQTEHPDASFRCPRRSEGVSGRRKGNDWWDKRDGHKACSYCGSMLPDELFAAIEAGAEIGPTDKSYKVYVDLPRANAKFYFQHLSPSEQERFIALVNEKKIKFGYPGHLYTMPFFCRPVSQ